MKKGYIVLIVIAVVVLSIFFWFKGAYNGMVNMREAVSAQWSNVENQYQRRLDLIPNLRTLFTSTGFSRKVSAMN